MADDLAPYRRSLAELDLQFKQALARTETVGILAQMRLAADTMRSELAGSPGVVLQFDRIGRDRFGFSGPQRWRQSRFDFARETLNPHFGTSEQLNRKLNEYVEFGKKKVREAEIPSGQHIDPATGAGVVVFGPHPLARKIANLVYSQLHLWAMARPNDRQFITESAAVGFQRMLQERPDLRVLLRIADYLPIDAAVVQQTRADRPALVTAVEFAVGLLPVVGTIVAAYEAWSGVDLFGYRLDDLDRGILGASVLLPMAGRLVKGGRAMYSEARLVELYGREAKVWSQAIGAGARGLAEGETLRAVGEAERALRVARTIAPAVAREMEAAIPRLTRGQAVLTSTVDREVAELFQELSGAHSELKTLDAQALGRVVDRGPNVNNLKGQLLEELLESQVVGWMQSREGPVALGVTVPAGKKLEFIPGHLVRGTDGRPITDGILGYRSGDELVILAVFEAKAGPEAARELRLTKQTLSELTKDERRELRAAAKDAWRDQRDEARAAGRPFAKTVEDVEKEFVLSEQGGQIRRDVERLADGASLRIAGQVMPVRISPTKTKFFGVLPKDLNASKIEADLKRLGFNFEVMGVDVRASTLDTIAGKIQPLAKKVADAAP